MFLTGGASGCAVTVSERACRPPSSLAWGSGDSPRELGGDVAGVISSDAQFSEAEYVEVARESVLMSRTSLGMLIVVGDVAILTGCEEEENRRKLPAQKD